MEENLGHNPILQHRSASMRDYVSTSTRLSPSKATNIFVQCKKLKKTVSGTSDIGFEYDHDVLNDDDFYRKIFEQKCYHPSQENLIDYYLEIKRMMETYDDQDRRNVGALVGITVLSLIGFFAFSFTIVGGIAGGVAGGTIGRYAGKKLRKKMKRKEPLTQEEFYRIKVQCMIKLGKIQKNLLKHNLNKYRTIIEKIIEESTPAFRFTLFQNPDKMISTVLKLRAFLLTVQAQKALLLSYKLFKIHFKQVTLEDPQGLQEAADKLNKVLIPYTKLMEIDAKTDGKTLKKLTNVVTYRKIKDLMLRPEIIEILERYPDPRTSQEYTEKLKNFMRENVDIEAQIKEHEKRLPQIVSQLQNADAEQANEEVSRIEIQLKPQDRHRASEDINPDEIDEENTKMQKELIRSLEIPRKKMLGDDLVEDPLKRSIPNKQGLWQTVQPKTPLSANLECPSAEQIQAANKLVDDDDDSSGDSSMKTDEKQQEEEEKLEDDPALYIDLDKANGMSVSEPRKKPIISPPKIKLAKDDIIQEIMEGASPTRRGARGGGTIRMATRRLEPTSLNSLEPKFDIHAVTNDNEVVRMNTYTHLDEIIVDNKQEEAKRDELQDRIGNRSPTRSPTKVMRDEPRERFGARSPTKVMRDEVDAKFSGLVAAKQASKTKKEMVFEKVLAIAYDEESKWEKVYQNNIIYIQKIKPEDSPVVLLRAWAFLEGITPKEVFDNIYDTTARAKWDTVLADLTVVDKIDYETEVITFVIKTPFGITERDFVQKRQFQHDYPEKGTITMSFQSTTHPAKPPMKNRIRGETHIAGYVIKPSVKDPNSTDLCILSQVDIKGNIPKAIVNMVSSRAPADWVNKLKKACEADRKNKKK